MRKNFDYTKGCRGKTVERITFSTVQEYCIAIEFTDETAMTFTLRPEGRLEPELLNYKNGDVKSIRRYPDQRLGS
jgi:hypothetical protein